MLYHFYKSFLLIPQDRPSLSQQITIKLTNFPQSSGQKAETRTIYPYNRKEYPVYGKNVGKNRKPRKQKPSPAIKPTKLKRTQHTEGKSRPTISMTMRQFVFRLAFVVVQFRFLFFFLWLLMEVGGWLLGDPELGSSSGEWFLAECD